MFACNTKQDPFVILVIFRRLVYEENVKSNISTPPLFTLIPDRSSVRECGVKLKDAGEKLLAGSITTFAIFGAPLNLNTKPLNLATA